MNLLRKTILLISIFLLSACQEMAAQEPKEPLWGRESCARCGMILSEKRFAVQGLLKTGDVHFYDDLNCALKHGHKNDEVTFYVRPFGGESWELAREAKYEKGLRTPMGSGYGAVKEGGSIPFSEIKHHFKD